MQRRGISKHAHHLFALGIAASLGFFALALAVTPVQTRADGSCSTITISANATNVNLFTLAGSPSAAGTYIFTINNGVIIGSNSTAQPALTTGTFPVGSTVTIVNNGSIYGMGGAGGNGGSSGGVGSGGSIGGPAISTSLNVSIDNTNGFIFGGGGGGGGGGGNYNFAIILGGGGGGGGQGNGTSSGGAAGVGYSGFNGNPGGTGNLAGAGGGGTGRVTGSNSSGNGAVGGDWGSSGGNGANSSSGVSGGAGGAAGPAISGSGNPTLTWIGGSDSTHVKGTVSGVTVGGSAGPTSCPVSCTFDGNTVTSGSSVTAYQSATVPYGNSCTSESRTCTNGTLSGSYTYASCTVDAQTGTPLTGYAWSDTIGWISLSPAPHTVSPSQTTAPSPDTPGARTSAGSSSALSHHSPPEAARPLPTPP